MSIFSLLLTVVPCNCLTVPQWCCAAILAWHDNNWLWWQAVLWLPGLPAFANFFTVRQRNGTHIKITCLFTNAQHTAHHLTSKVFRRALRTYCFLPMFREGWTQQGVISKRNCVGLDLWAVSLLPAFPNPKADHAPRNKASLIPSVTKKGNGGKWA